MKKLWSILGFTILGSLCAHGQAYSSLALQNSPGSYARAIPYAQLTLCLSTDTAVPCTQKAAIFTDDSLTTRCTATNSSGALTNAPISGANCNNPGISDANGNFTIFALAGNYRLCTFGQTTLCQEITVGGGGTGNITCPGANNGALAAWLNSTTVGCTNLAYTDFLGGIFSQFYQAIGPVNGEVKMTTVGIVPTLALPANTISWVAPNVVPTSLRMNVPGVECTDGQIWQQLSHGPDPTGTENIYFNCLTVSANALVTQTNSVNNISQTTLNLLNSAANCGFTVTLTNGSAGNVTLGLSGSTLSSSCLPATSKVRGISFTIGDPGGSALTAASTTTRYITVPFACTISAYNLTIDAGTITVKFWKIATGTAIPTSGNSISTSGVGISSGTAKHSTTVSDFTTTTVTANDILAMNVTAVATAKFVNGVLECDQ